MLLSGVLLLSGGADANRKEKPGRPGSSGPRLTSELKGSVPTRDRQRLRLTTDLGNVVIHTRNSESVDYHIHLETDASQKDAKQLLRNFHVSGHRTPEGVSLKGRTSGMQCSGRLWITFEVEVPKNYGLEISTGGGNIEAEDISGRVTLHTDGGNIRTGNIGGPARLETGGGHIFTKDIAGDLFATTGGGHVTTGSISGNASLHTNGGHIRVASVEGLARLQTGGGNVTIEHSGSELIAETAGGQIEVGETAGLVRAKTGGGGIRVLRVSGPTNLETSGGSIYLTQVDNAVKASTGAGGITAWLVSPPKSSGMCDLQSADGDIVVYLPRQLPVTIDAQVQMGGQHRVIVDPAFPLNVSYSDALNGKRTVRAEGALNGGGEVLHLRTMAGNIRLALSDTSKQMQIYKQQMEQLQQELEHQLQVLESPQPVDEGRPH
jgi:hypothetical protein